MTSPAERSAVLEARYDSMTRELKEVKDTVDKISEKLDRNYTQFVSNYATKKEVEDITSLVDKIMYSLLASALVIIISLVSFIYINGVK